MNPPLIVINVHNEGFCKKHGLNDYNGCHGNNDERLMASLWQLIWQLISCNKPASCFCKCTRTICHTYHFNFEADVYLKTIVYLCTHFCNVSFYEY